ncbi:hypothetical protein AUC68_10800 [Methyloceanibacter methanicus]|uniref:Crp/Fnr family transcriptional regulator n=1 Tax=Methyloceanibacter methanicus TaxID=1774968 RepID=A0A1E3VXI9_9HYPH|nr:Crp/Fnr family transcriptional regulator [Methyloceanibacter methanicus]ODR97991.1 hypothetical protein AUC68_10800 [Methyloceanibacter methanicus]
MTAQDDVSAAFPFVGAMAPTAQDRLLRSIASKTVAPGTDLLRPGDAVDGVYLVRRGAIRVYYIEADGREGTLYWIEPGQSCILALNSLFAEIPYPAFASADADGADFLAIPGGVFRDLFSHEPAAQRFLFDQLSGRVFGLLQLLEQRMRLPQEERLIALLLAKAGDTAIVELSQEELARHLGTSREVVSRLLRNLANQDLIDSRPRRIALRDPGRLKDRLTETAG